MKNLKKQTNNNEHEEYTTYVKGNRMAHVIKHIKSGSWGVHMIQDNKLPGLIEYYPTKSECWAENCAENFVEGIKNWTADYR